MNKKFTLRERPPDLCKGSNVRMKYDSDLRNYLIENQGCARTCNNFQFYSASDMYINIERGHFTANSFIDLKMSLILSIMVYLLLKQTKYNIQCLEFY